MLQRFEFLKVCIGEKGKRHYSRNFDILVVKMTYLSALYIAFEVSFSYISPLFGFLPAALLSKERKTKK